MTQAERQAHELLRLVPDVMKLGRRDPARKRFIERLKRASRDLRRDRVTATPIKRVKF